MIQHVYGKKFPIGEPSGEITPRLQAFHDIMAAADMEAPMRDNIRDEIWLKLWGNLCFNPISALTHATLDVLTSDPGTRALSTADDAGGQGIARQVGVHFRVDVEKRINGAGAVGAHKTSMLMDLRSRRPMEIDPLMTVVQEIGRLVARRHADDRCGSRIDQAARRREPGHGASRDRPSQPKKPPKLRISRGCCL